MQVELRSSVIQPQKKGKIFIYFVSFRRHGRVVRRRTANPFSPVQIWVSPDQQKTRNPLSTDITHRIIPRRRRGKGLLIRA